MHVGCLGLPIDSSQTTANVIRSEETG